MNREVQRRGSGGEKRIPGGDLVLELRIPAPVYAHTWEAPLVDFFSGKCRIFFHKIVAAGYNYPTSSNGRSD